jgi:hypothetical protein
MLREFGNAAKLFAGVLTDCSLSGDIRSVTFANGLVIRERLIAIDEDERRIVYTVLNGSFTQHSASMQIIAAGSRCRLVWISDFLPDEASAGVLPLIEAGCRAVKHNLETGIRT